MLINASVFIPVPYCFLMDGNGDNSRRSFIIEDCLLSWFLSFLPYETENLSFQGLWKLVFKFSWELYWIYRFVFSGMAIVTILIVPIHDHGRSFHLLIPSSIYFFNVLTLWRCKSFTCITRVTQDIVYLRLVWKMLLPWFLS